MNPLINSGAKVVIILKPAILYLKKIAEFAIILEF